MSNPEIRPRIIINTWIHGPVQLPEKSFEHPLPKGTYGILLSAGSKPEIDILDKEVEIYSNSLPGDPVIKRLAAVLSVEDAKSLFSQLPPMIHAHNGMVPYTVPHQNRGFNPDNYPPARIVSKPDIVENSCKPEEVEYPFPSGSEGLVLPLAIRGASPYSGEKVPMLLLNNDEATNLYRQLQQILKQSSFRGHKAISVEKELILPKRLVQFGNNQFIPV